VPKILSSKAIMQILVGIWLFVFLRMDIME